MQRQSGQVLIILLGSLLMGGSGIATGFFLTGKTSGEIRKDALAILEDANRRDTIKRILKRWETDVKGMDKTRSTHIDRLAELLQQRDATSDDFDPLFAQFDALQMQAFDTALAMRFALREQLSAEEWRKLFPADVSANEGSASTLGLQ